MPDEVLFDYYSNTKLSESSDMAKFWAARLCRLPKQVTGSAERLIDFIEEIAQEKFPECKIKRQNRGINAPFVIITPVRDKK